MSALWMQCKIEILRTVRNKFFLFFSLAMPLMFYIFFTRILVFDSVNQAEWNAHYLISMTVFSIISSSLFSVSSKEIMDKKGGWSTFVRLTPLPSISYFLAKIAAQWMVCLLTVITVFLFGFLVNQVTLPWEVWLQSGLWIFIASLPFIALGLVLGSAKKMETTVVVANIILFGLAILGGLWMPMESFPELMQKIAYWLPSYRYGEGAWNILNGESVGWAAVANLAVYFLLFMTTAIYLRKRQEAM